MVSKIMIVLAVCLLGIGKESASGQDYIPVFTQDYTSRLSVELDPAVFLLKGYSVHLRYQPMFSERFLIGVGAYAMDVPQYLLNLNATNRDKGWQVRIRGAYLLYGEFYPRRANYGWFIGEQVGFQRFAVRNRTEGPTLIKFNNVLMTTYIGYSWHPYKGSFYVKPWIGVGYTSTVDGTSEVGSLTYEVAPWVPSMALHLGFTF